MFNDWLFSDNPKPYNSFGNGAKREWVLVGLWQINRGSQTIIKKVTEITHNHPEGIKGAEAVAVAIHLARTGKNILEIRDYINKHYYKMNFKLDDIREKYEFNETCKKLYHRQ